MNIQVEIFFSFYSVINVSVFLQVKLDMNARAAGIEVVPWQQLPGAQAADDASSGSPSATEMTVQDDQQDAELSDLTGPEGQPIVQNVEERSCNYTYN